MVSETTIIPQEIKVDGVTIDKNGTGQLEVKETERNRTIRDIALNKLNIATLNINASLTDVNDDFIEDFVDADGLLGVVDTVNTNSHLSSGYGNNYQDLIVENLTQVSSTSTTYVLMKTLNVGDVLVNNIGHYFKKYSGTQAWGYFKFYYTDTTTENTPEVTTTSTSTGNKNVDNPQLTKTVSKVEFYGRQAGGQIQEGNTRIYTPFLNHEVNIYLNYDKSKPTKVLLNTFSDDTSKVDVGSYTYELVHIASAETTGELNPDVENTISMTNTPDRMIIHQKDTAVSKIKKFVLAVWE